TVFLVLYILDIIAIQALLLPYLRTFFPLKTTAVHDCSIPGTFEAGRKIKLRNSMVYRDIEDRALWLRPRGLNLVQIPLMVAKLVPDAGGKSIDAVEIRFSSGFPFVTALCLWAVYRFFSATLPTNTNSPLPALFVGFAALVILVASLIKLRTLRSRMEI